MSKKSFPEQPDHQEQVIQECLRQASVSFNFALILTTASAIVSIVGICLLFSGKIAQGTATTAGGLASNIASVNFLKLSKDNNDRIYQIAKDFKNKS